MLTKVGDYLNIVGVWPGEFDLAFGAEIAARVIELDRQSDPTKWGLLIRRNGRGGLAARKVPKDLTAYLSKGLEGSDWIVVNDQSRVSGTATKVGTSVVKFGLRRCDGVLDEELALRLVETCLAGGCEHVYTAVTSDSTPLQFLGLDHRYSGDSTMVGYGGITGINQRIADVVGPIVPVDGLDCSDSENGTVLNLGTVEPDHRQLQTVLDVIRPALRPFTLGISWIAVPELCNYATEDVRMVLNHMRTNDGPEADRARREFPDVLDHYERLLSGDQRAGGVVDR